MRLKSLDVAALVLSAAIVAAFSIGVYGGRGGADYVVIEASGKQWIYPLDADREVPVEGPLGVTLVVIRDGSAWVERSPCRNQICVAAGKIDRANRWIACLPNKVIVRIEGVAREGDVDAVTY